MQLCRLAQSGHKAIALADVAALYETHELAAYVAMKRRRPERVLGDAPAVADHAEVHVRRARDAVGAVSTEKIDGSGWS